MGFTRTKTEGNNNNNVQLANGIGSVNLVVSSKLSSKLGSDVKVEAGEKIYMVQEQERTTLHATTKTQLTETTLHATTKIQLTENPQFNLHRMVTEAAARYQGHRRATLTADSLPAFWGKEAEIARELQAVRTEDGGHPCKWRSLEWIVKREESCKLARLNEEYCDECKLITAMCVGCKNISTVKSKRKGEELMTKANPTESLWRCFDCWRLEEVHIISTGMTTTRITRWSEVVETVKEEQFHASQELNSKIALYQGDIVGLEIQAIVNAANRNLAKGGGVDGAISRAAGEEYRAVCKSLGGCEEGQAKLVKGYKSLAKYIIITVGPKYTVEQARRAGRVLFQCYYNVLELALQANITEVAFCSISTGAYQYPKAEAARIALGAARQWLITEDHAQHMDLIVFVTKQAEDARIYEEQAKVVFPREASHQNHYSTAGR